jgi:hypothetical protein
MSGPRPGNDLSTVRENTHIEGENLTRKVSGADMCNSLCVNSYILQDSQYVRPWSLRIACPGITKCRRFYHEVREWVVIMLTFLRSRSFNGDKGAIVHIKLQICMAGCMDRQIIF